MKIQSTELDEEGEKIIIQMTHKIITLLKEITPTDSKYSTINLVLNSLTTTIFNLVKSFLVDKEMQTIFLGTIFYQLKNSFEKLNKMRENGEDVE